MPGFDRTGPLGMGPGTGWGRGFCGLQHPRNLAGVGWVGRGRGTSRSLRGMGPGWGGSFLRPRFWRRGFFPFVTPSPDEEAAFLKEEAASLKEMLGSIERRLSELEKQKTD